MDPAENVEFKQFEVVATEPKDHHYLTSEQQGECSSSNSFQRGIILNELKILKEQQGELSSSSNSFQRAINKEWKILEESLPPGIYVRAYETQTNLLRALIIGARGTPYRHGLFFFDIFLPPDYPSTPPLVYYHSHGYRPNPNLYHNGRICLSLIDTWKGRSKAEEWSENSTLLQLLVSIQGLVLNEKPYFNEAGYEDRIGDPRYIEESNRYSETAFILSCKTLLKTVKHPPEGFEGFVVRHFQGQAAAALLEPDDGGTALYFKADFLDNIRAMINKALAWLNDKKEEDQDFDHDDDEH